MNAPTPDYPLFVFAGIGLIVSTLFGIGLIFIAIVGLLNQLDRLKAWWKKRRDLKAIEEALENERKEQVYYLLEEAMRAFAESEMREE